MKRKFLEDLGLSKEQIDTILDENGKDITAAKGDLEEVKIKLTTTEGQLEKANLQIQAFKDMDIDGIKQSAADWEGKYSQAVKDGEEKLNAFKFEHYLDGAITAAKAKNTKAVKALLDRDKLKLSGEEIIGLKEQLETLKADNDYLFEGDNPVPKVVGPTGSPVGGTGANPFGFNFTGVRAKEAK